MTPQVCQTQDVPCRVNYLAAKTQSSSSISFTVRPQSQARSVCYPHLSVSLIHRIPFSPQMRSPENAQASALDQALLRDSPQPSANNHVLFQPVSYRVVASLDFWQMIINEVTMETFIIWPFCCSCVRLGVDLNLLVVLHLTHLGQKGASARNRGFLLFRTTLHPYLTFSITGSS